MAFIHNSSQCLFIESVEPDMHTTLPAKVQDFLEADGTTN